MLLEFKRPTATATEKLIARVSRNTPEILISTVAARKMKHYVDLHKDEIAWLGLVKRENDKYLLYDVVMLDCYCRATYVEIDEKALMEYAQNLMTTTPEQYNHVRAWCHSHVNMAVNPSGTDDQTFEEYYKDCEFFFRIICNKKGEMRVDLADTKNNIQYDNIPYTIVPSTAEEVTLQQEILRLDAEINKLLEQQEAAMSGIEEIYAPLKESCVAEVKAHAKEFPATTSTVKIYNSQTGKWDDEDYEGNYGGYYGNYYKDYYSSHRVNEKKNKSIVEKIKDIDVGSISPNGMRQYYVTAKKKECNADFIPYVTLEGMSCHYEADTEGLKQTILLRKVKESGVKATSIIHIRTAMPAWAITRMANLYWSVDDFKNNVGKAEFAKPFIPAIVHDYVHADWVTLWDAILHFTLENDKKGGSIK